MDKDLGLCTNNSIHPITWIGRRIRGNDDTRPMRVTMKTVEDRKRVLERIRELRSNKDDKIVDIFIQPDLSQDERDERKKLRAEPVTILGSENCQSISLQNLLSASQPFQGL